ncbi:MAG TPA: hypothetical protein VFZ43_10155 [Anaerolineales bacterium]
MNALYPLELQHTKKESLQTQHEFLNLLRLRHLHWMNSTDDPEIEQLHHDIAELIRETTDRYHRLLDLLQERPYES